MTSEPESQQGPVIRDKRRIDPLTGQVREPQPPAAPSIGGESALPPDEAAAAVGDADGRFEVAAALAERTADLQRLQAEYVNYKRRVDRDRETGRQSVIGSVLMSLLPVLDDIERAREHDELTGGFKAVADSLQRTMTGLGLESFGEAGQPFDPRIHEALMHSYSGDVDGPVCQAVLQIGYRHGDRVLRPARVAVAEPSGPVQQTGSEEAPSDAVEPDAALRDVEEPTANGQ
ncbi:MAG: nucleotide exchange factor GrpE [Propionibacteriales bacterium]|nr:nucleotide exchange factor GrpE [Propionibacteriales bacterium]